PRQLAPRDDPRPRRLPRRVRRDRVLPLALGAARPRARRQPRRGGPSPPSVERRGGELTRMRRHGRSVHRKRVESLAGEPDALGLALPGLACGLLALALVLYAGTARRQPKAMPLVPIAATGSRPANVAPIATASLAAPDPSSL